MGAGSGALKPHSYADFRDDWATRHGGVDPGGSRWVDGWLRVSYATAIPFARLGLPADVLTALGLLAAIGAAVAAGRGAVVAGALLIGLSALLDGTDGAVAALRGRAGPWGAVLDSVVDRLADAAFLVALWAGGAPLGWCVAGWIMLGLLEYSRARAASLGAAQLAPTVGERPVRVAVAAMFLLASGVLHSGWWAGAGSVLMVAVSTVGWLTLLRATHRELRRTG